MSRANQINSENQFSNLLGYASLQSYLSCRSDRSNIRARLCGPHSIQTTRLCLSDKSHQKCLRSRTERVLHPMHRQPALLWCTVKSEPFLETTGPRVALSLCAQHVIQIDLSRRVVSNRAGISARWSFGTQLPGLKYSVPIAQSDSWPVVRGLFHLLYVACFTLRSNIWCTILTGVSY